MGVLRRLGRWLLDAWAMGGLATMGGERHGRTGHPLQTRVVADALLPTVRDEDEQDERSRAVWAVGGALALGALAVLSISASLELEVTFLVLLGVGQGLVAAGVLRMVIRRARSKGLYAAGIALAAASLVIGVVAPSLVLERWALATLLLGLAAVIGLAIGRPPAR